MFTTDMLVHRMQRLYISPSPAALLERLSAPGPRYLTSASRIPNLSAFGRRLGEISAILYRLQILLAEYSNVEVDRPWTRPVVRRRSQFQARPT